MPDTGAPWNIPYVAGTDLVGDWPTDNQQQAEAIADALDGAFFVKQLVSTLKKNTFSESTGSGNISGDVTDLTVTITPSDATSRLLVTGVVAIASSSETTSVGLLLYRDGSASDYRGNAGVSRTRGIGGFVAVDRAANLAAFSFVDTAGSTSATTYSVRLLNSSGSTQTLYVNRAFDDGDNARTLRGASSITVMEVAA